MIQIGGKTYELLHENRNGWNAEAFKDRYSEVLERYDFIIGDWGYSQLRLKGFFRDNHMKATKDTAFSGMVDYINEYCNFGCPYFIVEKTGTVKKTPEEEEQEQDKEVADAEASHSSELEDGDDLPENSLISAIAAGVAAAAAPVSAAREQQLDTQSGHAREEKGTIQQAKPHKRSQRRFRQGGDRGKKPARPSDGAAVATLPDKPKGQHSSAQSQSAPKQHQNRSAEGGSKTNKAPSER
ncbi:YutD family protein [Paenibacillus sp. NPDC058071]|uniref:YutD family protein n=1 Tax=Paenibacillus sp. NPDC058071 TaxID=3346326 RepID=UPI0036DD6332